MQTLLFLLLGCGSPGGTGTVTPTTLSTGTAHTGLTTIGTRPVEAKVSACLEPMGGWPDGHVTPTAFAATVLGTTTQGCSDAAYDSWVGPYDSPNVERIELEEGDGTRWTLAVALPGGSATDLVGHDLDVDFVRIEGAFSPDVGHLHVTESGERTLWLAEAGEPSTLDLPTGVGLTRGASVAEIHGGCGPWAYYDSELAIDGISETIGVGETASVGPATVTVGTHEHGLGSTACLDWFVARVVVGGWH